MANKTKQVLDSVAYLTNTESKYTTAHILSITIATRFVPICSVDVFNVWTAAAIKLLVQSRAVFLFLITGKRFLIYSEIIFWVYILHYTTRSGATGRPLSFDMKAM